MGNKQSRQYSYIDYFNAIKKDNTFDFNSIDYDKLNPYEVLQVSKNFTWDELKNNYRQIATITHPDKGGNKVIFNFVTETFKKLAYEYNNRQHKDHLELKKESEFFYTKNEMRQPIDNPEENFNEKFNKTFNMCKINDEEFDTGYGEFMTESSGKREDINIDNLYKNKSKNESFNDIFNKHVPITKQLAKYVEPEPLILAKSMSYSEIGGKRPDDYSSSIDASGRNNLNYTDYMKAYSNTRLVDPEILKTRKNFSSIEEYEKYRNTKIKKELTDKERRILEIKKKKEEEEEFLRMERVKDKDLYIQKNYEKANQLFLK
jgi:curved DNA-binding protein CbpA